jgi:two-component system cell cycle response regulator
LRRHPELVSALTLDSIARARFACGELTAAQSCIEAALTVEAELHCSDVQGDPWLTFAEIKLAMNDADAAWELLEHPDRSAWAARSSWTRSRDLKLRAQVLAAQQRWKQAYQALLNHLEAYEGLRSLEGDRMIAEFATVQIADEERRRAAEFEKLALTDALTGLPNRRRVERWLRAVAEAGDERRQVALAIIDLDHFKRINDTYSHDSGDEVLCQVARALGGCDDTDMLVARVGGEEFVQLSIDVSRAEAELRAEQLMTRLRRLSLDFVDPGLQVTASIGLAFGDPANPSGLLKAADRCLYAAKRAGRDRIVVEAERG